MQKELDVALETAKIVIIETVTVEKNCEKCSTHIEQINYLTSTLAKFTKGRGNLDVVLKSSGRVVYRQGIGYKSQSNRTNSRKFVDLSIPVTHACFYCNKIGHTVRNYFYRKVGVLKGLYKWIPKEHLYAKK